MEGMKFTLGWELEAISGCANEIVPEVADVGSDGSVHGEGLEYRLRERWVDDPSEAMNVLRRLVMDKRLAVDESCGFHVHIGPSKNMNNTQSTLWAAWCVNLGKQIEEAAFKAVPVSRADNQYCQPWRGMVMPRGIIKDQYARNKGSNRHRYRWINITEMFRPQGIRTVEIRLMGHSKRFTYLYSWTAFCLLLGQAAFRLLDDPARRTMKLRPLGKCWLISPMPFNGAKIRCHTP